MRNNHGDRGRQGPQLLSWVGPAMHGSPATFGMFSSQSAKPRDGGDEAQQYFVKSEDRSEAARRLRCFAAAILPHQGTVQRSGSGVYPEQFGLHTWTEKLMSDAPQTP